MRENSEESKFFTPLRFVENDTGAPLQSIQKDKKGCHSEQPAAGGVPQNSESLNQATAIPARKSSLRSCAPLPLEVP